MAKELLSKGKGKDNEYGATFYSLVQRIAAQSLGYNIQTDISHLKAVQHGIEFEPEAISVYEERYLVEVHSAQKWINHSTLNAGCTPDGLVGTDGMIEVKCPMSKNHLDTIINQTQVKAYQGQIQFSLWITGRQWCDFISYDPDAPEGLDLYVYRVYRDKPIIKDIEQRAKFALIEAARISNNLKSKLIK